MNRRVPTRLLLVLTLAAGGAWLTGCGDSGGDGTADTGDETGSESGATTGEPIPCDVATGDPCGEGEHCSYDQDGATVCFASGTQQLGEACDEEDTCESGICLSVNQTDSLCYALCSDDDPCAGGEACLDLDGVPFEVCEIEDIYDSCALLDQDCGEGMGCYSVADEDSPICVPAGDAAAGAACSAANDCAAGLVCVADTCHALCDTAATGDCTGTEVCAVYSDPESAGYCVE